MQKSLTPYRQRDLLRLTRVGIAGSFLLLVAATCMANDDSAGMRLTEWERGVSVHPIDHPRMKVYLWFYEWHMFDAIKPGQHTGGTWENRISVIEGGKQATIQSKTPGVRLDLQAVKDGATLQLHVVNRSRHDWPPLASMIACFNPGPQPIRNSQFANTDTWFHSPDGLMRLALRAPREIHYNQDLRTAIDAETSGKDRFAWTSKWPRSEVNAVDGLIIRESTDRRWVTAIVWERFLSAQGHNPWECMHLSVNVGPLARGKSRTVNGKIYLLQGTKHEALARYQADFGR